MPSSTLHLLGWLEPRLIRYGPAQFPEQRFAHALQPLQSPRHVGTLPQLPNGIVHVKQQTLCVHRHALQSCRRFVETATNTAHAARVATPRGLEISQIA